MSGKALISPDGVYRYWLSRQLVAAMGPQLTFIMLNPSTADATEDDATIRKCIGYARRENCTSLLVVNLFALRSRDPKALLHYSDPVGPDNDAFLAAAALSGKTVLAWGAHPFARQRAQDVTKMLKNLPAKKTLLCLGTTKDGSPRHPLYVRGDQPLVEYAP